jgi:hypothetical protein
MYRERMFSAFLGALKDNQPYKLLQWTVSGMILMCAPKYLNSAETHLVGHDSEHPHRPYSSALSHMLRNCLSL